MYSNSIIVSASIICRYDPFGRSLRNSYHLYSNSLIVSSRNWISEENGLISLPEDLSNCSNILKLDLEGNKLTVLFEKPVGSWTLLTELNVEISRNMEDLLSGNM